MHEILITVAVVSPGTILVLVHGAVGPDIVIQVTGGPLTTFTTRYNPATTATTTTPAHNKPHNRTRSILDLFRSPARDRPGMVGLSGLGLGCLSRIESPVRMGFDATKLESFPRPR